jgi:DNA-directed RNA polymerase specialized sigma24 family protein
MASRGDGSVTKWIGELKAVGAVGAADAAAALWDRYFAALARLAKKRLANRGGAAEDEEDAALSALDSVFAGMADGRFTRLESREDLWRLLVVVTARKASAQLDRQHALKRGGGWTRVDAGHDDAAGGSHGDEEIVARLVGREPDPGFAAMVVEETRILLDRLGDDQLRRIALDRMAGFSTDEIAERLGCARRTVARRLDLIRRIWSDSSS